MMMIKTKTKKWRFAKNLATLSVALLLAGGAHAVTFEEASSASQRGDYDIAYKGYKALAEQGDAKSQINMGVMYEYGLGVQQDFAEAAKWYRLAADQKNSQAQYLLGMKYQKGSGVELSYEEAARLFQLAVDQGLAPAQQRLGILYVNGQGVPKD